MKIALVGGGTGGHFYPLMAVASELRQRPENIELFYIGPNPYDYKDLENYQIKFVYCPAGKLRRYFSLQNFLDIFRNFFGFFVALVKLFSIYPDVIFSKGGYTSVPVLLAARFLRIPVVIHESDSIPGRANQMAKKFARYIGIAYDDAATYFENSKTALVGIPIRSEIKAIPEDPFAILGIPDDKPLIYVTGGSSGAERINNVVIRSLAQLLPHYRVYHQTGPGNLEEIKLATESIINDESLLESYYINDFISAKKVSALLAASSVVVTRAGSTSLFEIAYHGKPSVIIPIPEDISRDQRSNAYTYSRSGAGSVIEEANLTPNLLAQEIKTIIDNPDTYKQMSIAARGMFIDDAAKKISNILINICHEHK
jgi:UDP-N-acetylglucosamine--N-acetylmuramyl-(pentapeptide) pyrophosphoryl-undecaprenol N-acetylglucosamine transferase